MANSLALRVPLPQTTLPSSIEQCHQTNNDACPSSKFPYMCSGDMEQKGQPTSNGNNISPLTLTLTVSWDLRFANVIVLSSIGPPERI